MRSGVLDQQTMNLDLSGKKSYRTFGSEMKVSKAQGMQINASLKYYVSFACIVFVDKPCIMNDVRWCDAIIRD